jgi:hypothetical protein
MKQPFEIIFDFPLADPGFIVSLKATAELHYSDSYWVIDNFYSTNKSSEEHHSSILPRQEIKRITNGCSRSWVHNDSERETVLSRALGKAIDDVLNENGGN